MANVLVEETSLSNIASAIRGKNGSTAVYKPGEMAAAITNLPTGGGGSDMEKLLVERPGGTDVTYVNHEVTSINSDVLKGWAYNNGHGLIGIDCSNVDFIISSAFSGDRYLTSVNLPKLDQVSYAAFRNCERLPTINLPRCFEIDEYAFEDCTALTKVDLGNNLNSDYATTLVGVERLSLHGCTKMTTLILRGDKVFRCGGSPFGGNTPSSLYIYVPRALINEYKKATNWTVYANRFRAIEDYPDITGG